MSDTTGQLVIHTTDTTVGIYRDNGPYPGCKPELNVRRIGMVRDLAYLRLTDDVVSAPFQRGPKYGCAWGGGSALIALTDGEVMALVSENTKREAAAEEKLKVVRQRSADLDAIVAAIPPAAKHAYDTAARRYHMGQNEGGDGYTPYEGWASPGGLMVLREHAPELEMRLRAWIAAQ